MHITGDKVIFVAAVVLLLSIFGFLWGLTSQLGRLAAKIVAEYLKERAEAYSSWRTRSSIARDASKFLDGQEPRANMRK